MREWGVIWISYVVLLRDNEVTVRRMFQKAGLFKEAGSPNCWHFLEGTFQFSFLYIFVGLEVSGLL